MKASISAALSALLFALGAPSAAYAQAAPSANCSGFAAAPSGLPDGATASASRMNQGRDRVATWLRDRDAKLALCMADISALRTQLNALETAYNQAVAEKDNLVAAWSQEAEEYNARGRRSGGAN